MDLDCVYVVLFPETRCEDGYLKVFASKKDAMVCYLGKMIRDGSVDYYEHRDLFNKVYKAVYGNEDIETLSELVDECGSIWYEQHDYIYSGVYEMEIQFSGEVN